MLVAFALVFVISSGAVALITATPRPAVASEEEGLDISETGMYGYPRADREPCAGRRLRRNAVAGKTELRDR